MTDNRTSRAIEATRKKGAKTDWTMYELVNKTPGLSVYALARSLGWTTGKAYGSIRRLKEKNLVYTHETEKNGRLVTVANPTKWQDFYTKDELDKIKTMGIDA